MCAGLPPFSLVSVLTDHACDQTAADIRAVGTSAAAAAAADDAAGDTEEEPDPDESAGSAGAGLTEAAVKAMLVADLKAELEKRKLSSVGEL
jgi:hypothetical protein